MRLVKDHCPCCDKRIILVPIGKQNFPCPHCGKSLKKTKLPARMGSIAGVILIVYWLYALFFRIDTSDVHKTLDGLLMPAPITVIVVSLMLIVVCSTRFEAAEAEDKNCSDKDA